MSIFGDIAGLAAINTAYQGLGTAGDDVRKAFLGTSYLDSQLGLRDELASMAEFQPFAVSSGTGRSYIGDKGALDVRPSGMAADIQDALLAEGLFNIGPAFGSRQVGRLGGEFITRSDSEFDSALPTLDATNRLAMQNLMSAGGLLEEATMSPMAREQAIFERIRAIQSPEEQRQQLQLEERLASQGRLGVSTNLYGGTPEQLALSRAQSEARNTAVMQAMQQARAERDFAGRLGSQLATTGAGLGRSAQDLLTGRQARGLQLGQAGLGMLSGQQALETDQLRRSLAATQGAFIPQSAALDVLQAGLTAGGMAQQAQQFGTGLFGEATVSGLEGLLASRQGQADLLGEVAAGVLAAGARSEGDGLFDFLGDIYEELKKSDIRLKKNIEFVGKNQQGFNIYKWDWNDKANELGEFGSQVGVLAQELLETHPERVSVHDSGYYQVNYSGIWR
mgnify:CR=1 FL=1